MRVNLMTVSDSVSDPVPDPVSDTVSDPVPDTVYDTVSDPVSDTVSDPECHLSIPDPVVRRVIRGT